MKRCPCCGRQYEDGETSSSSDNHELVAIDTAAPAGSPELAMTASPPPESRLGAKSNSTSVQDPTCGDSTKPAAQPIQPLRITTLSALALHALGLAAAFRIGFIVGGGALAEKEPVAAIVKMLVTIAVIGAAAFWLLGVLVGTIHGIRSCLHWPRRIALLGILSCACLYVYCIIHADSNPYGGGDQLRKRQALEASIREVVALGNKRPQLEPDQALLAYQDLASAKVILIEGSGEYSDLNYRLPLRRRAKDLTEAEAIVWIPIISEQQGHQQCTAHFLWKKDGRFHDGKVIREGTPDTREWAGMRRKLVVRRVGAPDVYRHEPYYVTTESGETAVSAAHRELAIFPLPEQERLEGWVPEKYFFRRFILFQSEDDWYRYVLEKTKEDRYWLFEKYS